MTSGIWEGRELFIPLVISEGKGVVAGDGGVFNEVAAERELVDKHFFTYNFL